MSTNFQPTPDFQFDPSPTSIPSTPWPAVPTHPDDIPRRSIIFIAIAATFTFLATICVALRFFSRFRKSIKCWWDDWLILIALVSAHAFLATVILSVTLGGAGYHILQYTPSQIQAFLEIWLANSIFYHTSIAFVKLSLVFFYQRIFQADAYIRVGARVIGALTLGYISFSLGFVIFSCRPADAQWKPWERGVCVGTKWFWLGMAIFNITLDVSLMILPQRRVWKLQLDRKRKICISALFLLGTVVCIASFIRIYYLLHINYEDLTYTLIEPGLYTIVETDLSIICPCLPVIVSLFRSRKLDREASIRQDDNGGSDAEFASANRREKGTSWGGLEPPRIDTTITMTWDEKMNSALGRDGHAPTNVIRGNPTPSAYGIAITKD